jgi:hypothetical protein
VVAKWRFVFPLEKYGNKKHHAGRFLVCHFAKPPGRCTQAGQQGNQKQQNPNK